ncbi:MAG: DUF4175 domain-containing protein [Gammaproteobacteria bacterium]|nr:DUF4175 domain-containing protein [Gammaproteobacteria bacterium]
MRMIGSGFVAGLIMILPSTGVYADAVSKQIQMLNSQLQVQMQRMQETQQKQVQELNTKLQKQLKETQTKLQKQIQDMNKMTQKQLKEVQTSLEGQIKQIHEEMLTGGAVSKPEPTPKTSPNAPEPPTKTSAKAPGLQ